MTDQIEREHEAFCGFIQTLREYGNIIMEDEWHTLLNTAPKLDPDDKSGDTIHNFCLALADVLDAVRKSVAEPDNENVQILDINDLELGCYRCLENPDRQCDRRKL